MRKPASTDHQVHELIRERWSPRAFSHETVSDGQLLSLLEAARWAASCSNEQPWRFLVARRQDEAEFARLLSVASTTFARTGTTNRHALHDVGLAAAQLTLQATALGLAVHQMAGFSTERARTLYAIPPEFEPVAAIAVGHPGDPDQLPDDLRAREVGVRSRRPLSDIVFTGAWGAPLGGSRRDE